MNVIQIFHCNVEKSSFNTARMSKLLADGHTLVAMRREVEQMGSHMTKDTSAW